jgi:hypothetical protein
LDRGEAEPHLELIAAAKYQIAEILVFSEQDALLRSRQRQNFSIACRWRGLAM